MRTALRGFALVALLLVPGATAAWSAGEFGLAGALEFDGPVVIEGNLEVGYGRSPTDVRLLQAEGGVIRVTRFETTYVDGGVPMTTSSRTNTRVYENASWTMYGDRGGYLALLPRGETRATMDGSDLVVETRNRTLFGVVPFAATMRQDSRGFSHEINGPHFVQARASALLGPAFLIKFYGPRLVVETPNGPETIETGRFPDPGVPLGLSGTDVWAIAGIEGRAVLHPAANVALAFLEADARWSEALEFEARSGVVRSNGTHTLEGPGRVRLEGAFEGRLLAGESQAPQLAFEGELRRVTYRGGVVAAGRAPTPSGDDGRHVVAGAGFLALAAVVAYATHRRLAARPRPRREAAATAEDCHAQAAAAIEAGAWDGALAWIRQARKFAPASARLAHDEAFVLEALGSREAALAAYAEAAALGGEAFSAFGAARVAAALGRPGDEVVEWLARALAEDPGLAVDVLAEGGLAAHASDARLLRFFERL